MGITFRFRFIVKSKRELPFAIFKDDKQKNSTCFYDHLFSMLFSPNNKASWNFRIGIYFKSLWPTNSPNVTYEKTVMESFSGLPKATHWKVSGQRWELGTDFFLLFSVPSGSQPLVSSIQWSSFWAQLTTPVLLFNTFSLARPTV